MKTLHHPPKKGTTMELRELMKLDSLLSEKEMWSDVAAETTTGVAVIDVGRCQAFTATSPLPDTNNFTNFYIEGEE